MDPRKRKPIAIRAGLTAFLISFAARGLAAQDGTAAPASGGASSPPGVQPADPGSTKRADADRPASGTVPAGTSARPGFIDKGRIAEETAARLQGLRESGDPHIRKGLLIEGYELPPEGVQVDQDKLRADAIRMIEERPGFGRPLPGTGREEAAGPHQHGPGEEPCPGEVPEAAGGTTYKVAYALIAFAAVLASIVVIGGRKR